MKTTQYYITRIEYSPVYLSNHTTYLVREDAGYTHFSPAKEDASVYSEEECKAIFARHQSSAVSRDWKVEPFEACPEGKTGAYIDADVGKDKMNRPERATATEVGMGLAYKRQRILKTASDLISRERQTDYGPPTESFATIAKMWDAYLVSRSKENGMVPILKPHDVACMMILLKIVRTGLSPTKDDNWIDIAGYAGLGAEVVQP